MVSTLIPQSRGTQSILKAMQLLSVTHPYPHLPPLVVTGICHVKDVPVVEAQAPAGQPIVLVRVILEQRPDVERPLGAGPHQGARDVLLQLVQSGLVPAETRNVKRNAAKTKINHLLYSSGLY